LRTEHRATGKAASPATDEERQRIREQNARQHAERRINMPQQETQIIREQNTRRDAERRAEMTPEQRIQAREISSREHQERGVRTDLWVQRLASSKTLMNKSTMRGINYIQSNKYAYFAKLSKGKTKEQ
jgi:hypothetical protein